MTKRKIFLYFALAAALTVNSIPASAQMSDQSVIEYVKEGLEKGKTKNQIGTELLSKGVTASQIKRVMASVKTSGMDEDLPTTGKDKKSQAIGKNGKIDRNAAKDAKDSEKSVKYDKYGKRIDGKEMDDRMGYSPEKKKEIEELLVPEKGYIFKERNMYGQTNPLSEVDSLAVKKVKLIVFGHNLFDNPDMTFEPNQNVAVPADYVLGPEDEVIIDIFGMSEDQIIKTITPEGRIYIANIGPVQLSGLTIEQAKKKLRSVLSSKYSLGGSGAQSDLTVTLGNIRTIQVNILGEVRNPGTYRLSSLSSVLNALYSAGGVTPLGSLRSIRVVRGGKTVGTEDIYSLLFDGKDKKKIQLKEGDMIVVPAYEAIVGVKEGVRRPMFYEAKEGEPVGNIIKYAGGFTADAYHSNVSVQRRTDSKGEVFTVKEEDFGAFGVCDGDFIVPYLNHPENQLVNMVTISGYVLRPGTYEIGRDIATVKQLVEKAGGLLDGAFRQRAQLVRENPDRTLSIEGVAIGAVMNGTMSDILLRKNDQLVISSYTDMKKQGDVEILGYITNPGTYKYAEGMTVEDLIQLAGGLEEGASAVCVEVGRRLEITDSKVAQDTIARVYTYEFNNDLSLSEGAKFTLEPNDVVSVRKNPTYVRQRNVLVSGEVTFPGQYTLVANNQRLSDIFKRAGGATNYGNIKAAYLKRNISEYERDVRRNMVKVINNDSKVDSLQRKRLTISETYTVGIDLDKALENPGGEDDIVLQDGDELIIPSWTNTVRVQGAIYYPNAVNYQAGQNLSYYVNQAGGFTQQAKPGKTYVVYMNGKVSVGLGSKIKPGCEVVVPSKPDKKKMTTGEWVGIGTAAASMAASIASVITLIVSTKK